MTEPNPPGSAPGGWRPVSIFLTVACAVAGLVDLQAFSFAFSRQMRELSASTPWIRGLGAGVALLQILCLVILWRGQRLGLYGYVVLALIYAAVFSWAVSATGLCSLLPAVLVVAAGVWNWERLH
ncbi:MAG TPA: hypothetical protein VMH40_08340 [Myxococcaceae bacterium]|nr:hypothetical protein [Myxococcaceae bacterium]